METTASQVTLTTVLKNSSYGVAFVFGAEFLSFSPDAGFVLIVLMLIDTFTGVIRSAIVNGRPSVQSSIGIRGLLSKMLTIVGLISFALTFKGVGYDPGAAIQGVVVVFIFAELYSIVGNIHSSLTKQPKSEYDAMAFLVGIVGKLLEKAQGKPKN